MFGGQVLCYSAAQYILLRLALQLLTSSQYQTGSGGPWWPWPLWAMGIWRVYTYLTRDIGYFNVYFPNNFIEVSYMFVHSFQTYLLKPLISFSSIEFQLNISILIWWKIFFWKVSHWNILVIVKTCWDFSLAVACF